jgi:hypothetical protein
MTTYQKAEDLAWRYLRMAKQHVKSASAYPLMTIGQWACQHAELEYSPTVKVVNAAKQHAFHDQAIQILKSMPDVSVAPALTADDLCRVTL